METVQAQETPFNLAQLELLKLFSRVKDEKELFEIKELISQYYTKKLLDETDRIWEERGYTQETMDGWLRGEH